MTWLRVIVGGALLLFAAGFGIGYTATADDPPNVVTLDVDYSGGTP